MKFKVTMKDPDTLCDAVTDAIQDQLDMTLPEDEADALLEIRRDKISSLCRKWFEYGEYLTVEIDTDAGTATVCEMKS